MKTIDRFTTLQKQEIHLAQMHGLLPEEIKVMAKPKFNHLQMKEIRLGFEQGLSEKDVRIYAKRWMEPERMKQFRETIKLGDRDAIPPSLPGGFEKDTWFWIGMMTFLSLMMLLYLGKAIFYQKAVLKLNAEEVTLRCGDRFDATEYIETYTPSKHSELILPTNISTLLPRTYVAVYELKDRSQIQYETLVVHIEDQTPPTILLSEDAIVIKEEDGFDCRSYIVSAMDNLGKDYKEEVACDSHLKKDIENQEVLYAVQDEVGNQSQAILHVTIQKVELNEDIEENTLSPEELAKG